MDITKITKLKLFEIICFKRYKWNSNETRLNLIKYDINAMEILKIFPLFV